MKIEDSKLEDLTGKIKKLENVIIIIADDSKKLKKVEFDTWSRNIQNDTDGIWIGTGLGDQNMFKLSKITKEMKLQDTIEDELDRLRKLIDAINFYQEGGI
jgi:hypothetical protein